MEHLRFRHDNDADVARERRRLLQETRDLIQPANVQTLIDSVADALLKYRILEGQRLEDVLNGPPAA